jgi:hypothetical protein
MIITALYLMSSIYNSKIAVSAFAKAIEINNHFAALIINTKMP